MRLQGAEKAQLFFAGGYCKSILAHIDPQNSMADAISQLKDMDFEGSDLSDLERLGAILSQRLVPLDKASAAQDETMAMLLQDAEKMSKEQAVLTELRLGIIEAQGRVDARVAQKKREGRDGTGSGGTEEAKRTAGSADSQSDGSYWSEPSDFDGAASENAERCSAAHS